MAIVEEVAALREQTLAAVAQAADTAALDQVRVAVLGKSGTLTGYLRSMGQVPKEERAQVGMTVNEPVSYTHLDVYKRQPPRARGTPWQ